MKKAIMFKDELGKIQKDLEAIEIEKDFISDSELVKLLNYVLNRLGKSEAATKMVKDWSDLRRTTFSGAKLNTDESKFFIKGYYEAMKAAYQVCFF